jgi:cyclophilin family peptidyl-prolyl cis-trans isomerase
MTDRRQRQKELRAARMEEEKRQATRREFRKRILMAIGIGLGLAATILVFGVLSNRPAGLPSSYLAFRDLPTACGAEAPPLPDPAPTFTAPGDQNLDPTIPLTARLITSCGEIVIELDHVNHPQTVNNLVFLAREDFYDSLVFHRIFAGFVIQDGDPNANGTGNPGYTIADEFPPANFVYEPGVVAMANRGPGTTGSQFFIVIGENAAVLGNTFSIVGRVTSGDDTLDAIAAIPTAVQPGSAERSRPLEAVYIEDVVIEAAP